MLIFLKINALFFSHPYPSTLYDSLFSDRPKAPFFQKSTLRDEVTTDFSCK